MGKRLAVILGAGASFDVIPPDQQNMVLHAKYAPPLTEGLFSMSRDIEKILDNYELAQIGISRIRTLLDPNKDTLESMLRQFAQSTEPHDQQQFRQIPLYLQHLFIKISENYCRLPVNYASLVTDTQRSDVEAVAYITLNYDLLLEQALERVSDGNFNSLEGYFPKDEKWMYAKLHGSANWGRKFRQKALRNGSNDTNALLKNLKMLNPDTEIEKEINIHNPFSTKPNHKIEHYPAMTVPIEGKDGFNCPPEHLNKISEFLGTCHNYLIIGVSGRDNDLLELVAKHSTQGKFVCLVVGDDDPEKTSRRFGDGVPQLNQAGWRIEKGGFSAFMERDGVNEVLNSIS